MAKQLNIWNLKTPASADVQAAVDGWNEAAKRAGWPPCRMMTVARKRRIQEILAAGGVELWLEALGNAEGSDFLTGRAPRGPAHESWRLGIDTFIRPDVFARIVEGAYSNRSAEAQTAAAAQTLSPEESQWRARLAGYAKSKFWMTGSWGPAPGEPGCIVPPNLLTH